MEETKRTRAKKPEIKISLKDFNALNIYSKAVKDTTPAKIVNELIADFLNKPNVKQIIAENSISEAKKRQIEKKKAQIEKLKAELAELEKTE